MDVLPAMKGTRTGQSQTRHAFGRVSLSQHLVVGQIAISLVMLVAAGLFVRTLSNLQSIELGFNRENVLLFQMDARKAGHKDPEIVRLLQRSAQTVQRDPGRSQRESSQTSLIQSGHGLPISAVGSPRDPANRYLTVGPAILRNNADSDSGWP